MSTYEELPLTHKVGDSFLRRLTVSEREAEIDPWEPVNLTGYQVVFGVGALAGRGTAKKYRSTDDPALVFIVDDGGEGITPEDGVIQIAIPGEETRSWWERFEVFTTYEVTLIAPDGNRLTIIDGPITLRPEVVRDPHNG